MFDRLGKFCRGARLLVGDAMARADEQRGRLVVPFVATSKGPALGLDGQAYLLKVSPWDVDWPVERKRAEIGAALKRQQAAGRAA